MPGNSREGRRLDMAIAATWAEASNYASTAPLANDPRGLFGWESPVGWRRGTSRPKGDRTRQMRRAVPRTYEHKRHQRQRRPTHLRYSVPEGTVSVPVQREDREPCLDNNIMIDTAAADELLGVLADLPASCDRGSATSAEGREAAHTAPERTMSSSERSVSSRFSEPSIASRLGLRELP